MNFDSDAGVIARLLTIDTSLPPPLGGSNSLLIIGSGGLAVPAGTTAERPEDVPVGAVRWNTTLEELEHLTSGGWVGLAHSDGDFRS